MESRVNFSPALTGKNSGKHCLLGELLQLGRGRTFAVNLLDRRKLPQLRRGARQRPPICKESLQNSTTDFSRWAPVSEFATAASCKRASGQTHRIL